MEFDLLNELKKYRPYDNLETQNTNEVIKFLTDNTNCYDRSNLSGHITAGGFICDGNKMILLNHHLKSGMWFQFGGHSDGNTNSLEVAIREVEEEASISDLILLSNTIYDVDIQKIDYSTKKNEPEHFHYDINFLFYAKNKKFQISNESTEIKWVTIDEARKLVNPLDTGINRMIDKYEIICKANKKNKT